MLLHSHVVLDLAGLGSFLDKVLSHVHRPKLLHSLMLLNLLRLRPAFVRAMLSVLEEWSAWRIEIELGYVLV